MTCLRSWFFAILIGLSTLAMPREALATPSIDACTGVLAPALSMFVEESGTWCLNQDVVLDVDAGASQYILLQVVANDVTIDCRGHRLTFVGPPGNVIGIRFDAQRGGTVRNCRLRGFATGIMMTGGGGSIENFLVEDNTIADMVDGFTGSPQFALFAWGNGMIRRNRILESKDMGMYVAGNIEVQDNVVDGLVDSMHGGAAGIHVIYGGSGEVNGNTVRGLRHDAEFPGNGPSSAIRFTHYDPAVHVTIRDNVLAGDGVTPTIAIECIDRAARVIDNVATGFSNGIVGCVDAGDNDIAP
jgi:Right handed beta helix region